MYLLGEKLAGVIMKVCTCEYNLRGMFEYYRIPTYQLQELIAAVVKSKWKIVSATLRNFLLNKQWL